MAFIARRLLAQDKKQADIVREISSAWESAKEQLESLRSQVERAGQLAQAKSERDSLQGARDKALRELGSQVLAAVRKGQLSLPNPFASALRAADAAAKKLEAQALEINELLAEPEAPLPKKNQNPTGGPKSTVANRLKKR